MIRDPDRAASVSDEEAPDGPSDAGHDELSGGFPFAEFFARQDLSPRDREIATIAALTGTGNAREQLETHIAVGLDLGLERREIVEVLILMAIYGGLPAAIEGLDAAKSVFARRDA